MRNWKRTLFYLRRGLLRWAVMFFGTLLALCTLVYVLESADGRMIFYLIASVVICLAIGSVFYSGEEKTNGKR